MKPRARSRIGPKDFEARLYPLIQRESASTQPANYWEVLVSQEDELAFQPALAARFAFDAIEHFALAEPTLGTSFVDQLLVVASAGECRNPDGVSVSARWLDPEQLASKRAQAVVLKLGWTNANTVKQAAPVIIGKTACERPDASRLVSPHGKEESMSIKGLFSALAEGVFAREARPQPQTNRIDPLTIVQNTCTEVDRCAMSWPDGKDLPHRVIIHLSQADFAYYGPRRSACERHIEEAILNYAYECGALLEHDPRVSIKVDTTLYSGQMRIEASFDDEPASNAQAAVGRNSNARNVGAGAPGRSDVLVGHATTCAPTVTREPSGNDTLRTPVYRPSGDSLRTPERGACNAASSSLARLANDTFQTAVLPGDTIGRTRYLDRPKPHISLDGSEFEFVSQDQGLFEHDRDGWFFTSNGRNGTSVQRKGTWIKLTPGTRFALEDGDSISFAKCVPLTFSIAS